MFFPDKTLVCFMKHRKTYVSMNAQYYKRCAQYYQMSSLQIRSFAFIKNCCTNKIQDCSYQGKALNVPAAFQGLWSSSINIKNLNQIK